MKTNASQTIGELIRQLREEKELPLRKIAAQLDIDTSFLSKIERNERRATKDQIVKLAEIFNVEKNYLLVPYLSEIVYYQIGEEDCANEVLKVAEEKVSYQKTQTKKKK
ncbi:MAG: helix-turn-helix transcriptional regulator [bacterium]|nr:helix-turn-helix transcriptional regulator [bacterium]